MFEPTEDLLSVNFTTDESAYTPSDLLSGQIINTSDQAMVLFPQGCNYIRLQKRNDVWVDLPNQFDADCFTAPTVLGVSDTLTFVQSLDALADSTVELPGRYRFKMSAKLDTSIEHSSGDPYYSNQIQVTEPE